MVSKYELGQRSPKITMANAFAAALETTLDELLGVEAVETPEFRWEKPQDPEIKIVSGMMEKMTKEQQDIVIEIIKSCF